MAQTWAKAFYNSGLWKQQRANILKRDRYKCTEPGCRRTAEEVHHIKPLTEKNVNDPHVSLDPKNLRSLCGVCHKRITKAMMQKNYGILEDIVFDENGYPISAEHSPREGG